MPKPWTISLLRTAILLLACAGIDLAAHAQTPPCGQPGLGSCFQPSGTPGCNDVACCETVCSFDPFCCQLAWDGACAALAQGFCVPCLQCVSGSIPEGEPCGANTLNPGCDVPNGPLSILAPGDLICGQLWADSGQRDSDWYAFQVDDPDGDGQAELGISFGAGAPASLTMFDGACGSLTQVWETTADCLGGLSYVFCVPAPRTYRLRVRLVDSVGYECTSPIQPEYLLEAIIGSHTGCATLCCPVECPPGAILEGESCGSDANGGCNSIPPAFESIGTAGVEICGTAWADGDFRDTDWFELSLATPCTVTIRVEAAFPPLAIIVDGNGQCSGAAVLSSNSGPECSTVVTHAVLPAGNWWLVVLPDTFNGYPCGSGKNSYVASIDCLPLPTTDCDGNGSQDVSGLDPFCCTCICAGDPFCCGVLWDATCVDAAVAACERDCNANGSLDTLDVLVAASVDCNGNCVPDECEARCDANCTATACSTDPDCCWCLAQIDPFCCTVWDALCSDLAAQICDQDCNCNGIPDSTDVRSGASSDCNANCIPDECEQISVAVAPTSASASPATICEGQSSVLGATGGSGLMLEWFTGSCGGTLVGTGNNLIVTPATTTTYFVRWGGPCSQSTCVQVTVTVNAAPTNPVVPSATASVCPGDSLPLTATTSAGAVIDWHTGSCNGPVVFTGSPFVVTPSSAGTTTYYASARNTTSGCESLQCASVTVTANPLPPTPIPTATPQVICLGSTSTLTAAAPVGATIDWYVGANLVGTGSPFVVSPTMPTTYTAVARVIATGCTSMFGGSVLVSLQGPPSITCPANVSINCAASTNPINTGTATATSNCGVPTVNYNDSIVPGACAGSYVLNRTWTAIDASGSSASCVQVITVTDTTAPTIGSPGANATISCPLSPSFTPPTATDDCSGATVSQVGNDVVVAGTCAASYAVTRSWNAVDGCGNVSATVSQTITVVDSTPPSISALPAPSTIECPATPVFATPTATDGCGSVTLSFVDTSSGTCPVVHVRTWTATDLCRNASTASQTISVNDTIAPTIACPANITVACNGSTSTTATGMATASDACSGTLTPTFGDTTVPDGLGGFLITRLWTATDACGLSASCTQSITVTPPGPCGCGVPPTQTIWYPDNDGDGCGDPAGPTITQCANLPAPVAPSTCPGIVASYAYVTNKDDTCDCVAGDCPETDCTFVPSGLRARLYTISGPPTGTGWSWIITSPDFSGGSIIVGCCVSGVASSGTTFQVAQAFAQSINARGAALTCATTTQLQATAIPAASPPNTAYITVRVGDQTGTPLNPAWTLGVGPCGGPTPPNGWCFAQTFTTDPPASTQCQFNPTLIEIPASGVDCNHNEVDDAFDIALGTSLDLDSDGVPDDCRICVGDLDGNQIVGAPDLAILLGAWGGTGPADLDGSGSVDAPDIAILLGAWGPCP